MFRIRSGYRALLALVTAAGIVSAQGRHAFVVVPSQSGFNYSGNVSVPILGSAPIQGVPNNSFKLVGTQDLDLTLGAGGAATSGRLVSGGFTTTSPPLTVNLPNPLPFFPPLATIQVTGLEVEFLSVNPSTLAPASFSVSGSGAFNSALVESFIAGTVAITASGSTTNVDLAGLATDVLIASGSILPTSDGMRLTLPLSTSFNFADPGSGVSGNLNINGTIVADYRPLNLDKLSLSLSSGGVQTLFLSTGGVLPLEPYLILGSLSGTSPGTPLGAGLVLPLNFDTFTGYTLSSPNTGPFVNTFGFLDGVGKAQAAISLPSSLSPALAGTQINWAYAVIDLPAGNVGFASNPGPLTLN